MNRREREEFARIERQLMEDPSFGSTSTLERNRLMPFRVGRAAVLAGVALGLTPLAIEFGFLPLALFTVVLALLAAARWVRLIRVAYRAEVEGPPRLSPLVLSGLLFTSSAVVTLLSMVVLLG